MGVFRLCGELLFFLIKKAPFGYK